MQEVARAIVDQRVWGLFAEGDAYVLGLYDGQKTWLVRAREVILAMDAESNLELAAMVGCALDCDPERGRWSVRHDADGRTSQPNLFVVDDGAASAPEVTPDEGVVCHCEGISRDAIISVIDRDKVTDPNELKRLSRAGMGVCQGRDCRTAVARLLAEQTGRRFCDVPLTTFRAPVRPIPLRALATEEHTEVAQWEEWAPGVWRRT